MRCHCFSCTTGSHIARGRSISYVIIISCNYIDSFFLNLFTWQHTASRSPFDIIFTYILYVVYIIFTTCLCDFFPVPCPFSPVWWAVFTYSLPVPFFSIASFFSFLHPFPMICSQTTSNISRPKQIPIPFYTGLHLSFVILQWCTAQNFALQCLSACRKKIPCTGYYYSNFCMTFIN